MPSQKVRYTTAPEWEDGIGQVYRPGDIVAITKTGGNSAYVDICEVVEIVTSTADGTPLKQSTRIPGPDMSKPDWRNSPAKSHWEDRPTCKVKHITICDSTCWEPWRGSGSKSINTCQKPENILKLNITKQELATKVKYE